jgi:hypothetical protein
MTDIAKQPDGSVPTPERQAQLKAAYARNQHGPGNFYQREFAIRTQGELYWFMRDQGWSGDIDDRRTSRVQLSGVSFQRANIRAAHLYMAVLQDSSFLAADLHGAILIGAHLLDTNFTRATQKVRIWSAPTLPTPTCAAPTCARLHWSGRTSPLQV